jgi:branched-chain amino acid transport system permease protein
MGYALHLLTLICCYGLVALGQRLLFGKAGLLLCIQGAALGVGAYATALSAQAGFSSPLALSLGVVAGACIGAIGSSLTVRLRDDYLLVASLGLCEIVRSLLHNSESLTGGAAGLMGIPSLSIGSLVLAGPFRIAPLAAGLLGFGVVIFRQIETSPYGRLLDAIRQGEATVLGWGKEVARAKLAACLVATSTAGLTGGILALYLTYLDPLGFSLWESVLVLSMVIVGGTTTLIGPLGGAALLILLPEALRFAGFPPSVAGPMRQVVYGIALITIIRLRPSGLFVKPLPKRGID